VHVRNSWAILNVEEIHIGKKHNMSTEFLIAIQAFLAIITAMVILLLIIFPVVYLLMLGSYKVRFVRNLMPVLPYFAIWIGFGAVQIFNQVRQNWSALGRMTGRAGGRGMRIVREAMPVDARTLREYR